MVNESQLVGVIKQAKENDKDRKFTQAIEMIMVFKDVDVKKLEKLKVSKTLKLLWNCKKPIRILHSY